MGAVMKKIVWFLCLFFVFSTNVNAEIYHGIDIDQVYNSSDWNSKDRIYSIINDYNLLLQCKQRLDQCSQSSDKFNCMNTINEDVIKHFYNHELNNNLNEYHNYVKSTFAAYGVVYCLNKYRIPPGTMCNQETNGKAQEVIEQYSKDLLQTVEKILSSYSFLRNYKD